MTKNEVIKLCKKKFGYYDLVDETEETIDYGKIIDFLIDKGVIGIGGKNG